MSPVSRPLARARLRLLELQGRANRAHYVRIYRTVVRPAAASAGETEPQVVRRLVANLFPASGGTVAKAYVDVDPERV